MALTAAVGAAVAAWCAFTASGVPGWVSALFAAGLFPGMLTTLRHPERRPLNPQATKALLYGGGMLALLTYVVTDDPVGSGVTGVSASFAVIVLSSLWPQPSILRACVALSAVVWLSAPAPLRSIAPVAAFMVASAIAMVASNRMGDRRAGDAGPPIADERSGLGRLSRQAVALAAVVTALALAAAALVPRPGSASTAGLAGTARGGGEDELSRGGEPRPDAAPQFADVIDAGSESADRGDDDPTVLRIRADAPDLWRATTYDRWDGRRWTNTAPKRTHPGGFAVLPTAYGEAAGAQAGESFTQRVTVEVVGDVLVGSATPAVARVAPGLQLVVADDGTARTLPRLGKGATYIVVSNRSRPSPDEMRRSGEYLVEFIKARYRDPPLVSDRVGELVADLTGPPATTYDKVRAVEEWIDRHFATVASKSLDPSADDVVDATLFGQRRATALQQATAMAVMVRAAGIPARLARGFLPGERSLFGEDFSVRAGDEHAWVEVWLGAHGWQSFDPTGLTEQAKQRDSLLARLGRFLRSVWALFAAAAVAVATWAAVRMTRCRRRWRSLPWETRTFIELTRAGAARGRPRRQHETPNEYSAEVGRTVLTDDRLAAVGEVVTAAAYSRRRPPPQTREWAEQVLREAEAANPRRRGRRRRAGARRWTARSGRRGLDGGG